MKDDITTSQDQEILVFSKVLTSIGNGYDSSTGVFTAPVTGVYFFVASALLLEDNTLIILRSEEDCLAMSLASAGTSCAVQGTVKLFVGQKVHVVSWDKGKTVTKSATSFTGMLIHPEL